MLDFIDRTVIPFFLSLYDAVGYLGVAVAVGLETFVPIIPSEVIVPMAGWKVSQSAADPSVLEPLTHAPWSWLVVLVIVTLGAVAGSFAGYLIGAWGGRPLLDRWGRYVHIKPDDLDRADAWFARYGDRAVFIARLVPLLRALINYPAGVARMPVGRFLLFSALGSLPWNAALLLGGFLLGENYRHLYDAIRPFEFLIYAVVLVGVVYVIYRWLRGRGGGSDDDKALAALVSRSMEMPYPSGLAGEEINGVEIVLLDPEIIGYGLKYKKSDSRLTDVDRATLIQLLADCDSVVPELPSNYAREMFLRVRAVGAYLLDKR